MNMVYNVMFEEVAVIDRDLIKILEYAEVGIKVAKALKPNTQSMNEEIATLDELESKAIAITNKLKSKFCI